jgi:hypothetical protein
MERPSPTLFREPFEPPRQATAAVRLLFLYQIDQLARHAQSTGYQEPASCQLDSLGRQLQELAELVARPEPLDPVRVAKTCANAANYLAFYLVRIIPEIRPTR